MNIYIFVCQSIVSTLNNQPSVVNLFASASPVSFILMVLYTISDIWNLDFFCYLISPSGHCVRFSVNKLWESGGMLPQETFLKLGTLRSLLRPYLGQSAARIAPPVVSVAREAIEPSCQK